MSDQGHFDYLIVGQGLAGTCLAHTLEHKYHKNVFVIDRDAGAHCSGIAIGTFNPLAFKNFAPTWMAEKFVPFLNEFYTEMGMALGVDLLIQRPVFKTMKNQDQLRLWKEKSGNLVSAPFMEKEIRAQVSGTSGSMGFGQVKQSGNLKLALMIEMFREKLKKEGRILEETMDFNRLKIGENSVSYESIEADKLVFCQGHEGMENSYFNWLPFKQTKGEVLIIRAPGLNSEGIIHDKINIVPMGDDCFWVGSTFEWVDMSYQTTEEARKKLSDQLKETLKVDFEILEQKAGIRPTVKDRRPVLGRHPEMKPVFVFNGMGTRGVMIAPYFSQEMAAFMEEGRPLNQEVRIERFIG